MASTPIELQAEIIRLEALVKELRGETVMWKSVADQRQQKLEAIAENVRAVLEEIS